MQEHIYMNRDPAWEKITDWLLFTVRDTYFKGSLIVATDDEVIFASGTYLKDVEGNTVTPFTTYEIGSLTKSFTAACVLKLAEEGRLSPEDTLGGFFPEYSGFSAFGQISAVTVRDLLHMRSGLPDYLNAPDLFFGPEVTGGLEGRELNAALYEEAFVDRLLQIAADDGLFLNYLFSCEHISAPDAAYAYSNTDYLLLAMIIERVSGMPYEQYMSAAVFAPCGMNDSSAMSSGIASASVSSRGWRFRNAGAKGAGDIFSSVIDLLRYDRALFGGQLLGDEATRELLTPEDGYGCGWFVSGDTVYHTGGTPGFSSSDYIITRGGKHLYIIVLSDLNENRGYTVCAYLNRWFEP
ncbi:MAG: hypothetical protein CW338_01575 [Clostridiales bacterium]|nr:hypothetical protein [Clostridiales bacterium]